MTWSKIIGDRRAFIHFEFSINTLKSLKIQKLQILFFMIDSMEWWKKILRYCPFKNVQHTSLKIICIGAGAFNRACECSNTGSLSSMCDKYYGGCSCKSLVIGRRCDVCAPAAFGFGGSGCRRCDCHYKGSHDEFCNQASETHCKEFG